MGLIQRLISNQVFGTDSESLTVDNSHIFVDNAERDSYFVANPTELRKDIYIQVGEGFQRYSGSEWIDVSAILLGKYINQKEQIDFFELFDNKIKVKHRQVEILDDTKGF